MDKLETSTQPDASPRTTLRGRPLLAARSAWIAITILVVGLFVASMPIAYSQYQAVCAAGAECPYWRLAPEDLQALRELGVSAGFYAAYMLAVNIVYTLGFWVIGAVIFWRKADDRLALLFSLMLVTFGASNIVERFAGFHPALGLLGAFVGFFGYVLFFVSFFVFPDGRFVPRWGVWPVVVWTVYLGFLDFLPDDSPLHPSWWPTPLTASLFVGLLGIMVYAQVYRYLRVSGPVERQQIKWVVFGLAAAVTIWMAVDLPAVVFHSTLLQPGIAGVLYTLAEATVTNFAMLLIPLSIAVAIFKYRLWDIDVIINRTLVYGILTAALALVYGGSVVVLQGVFRSLTGPGSDLVVVASTLAIAALFQPLRRRIQTFIDRRFYRKKYDARKILETFGARMRDEVDLKKLTEALVEAVDETMKPSHLSLWLRPPPKKNR